MTVPRPGLSLGLRTAHLPATPQVAHAVRLPASQGGALCQVRAWRVNGRWVVELGEHADNRGLPVTQVFPALSARVRSFLPQGPEPVWIEHWPQRALLAQVLGEPGVFGRHLRARIATGIWIRTPLPWSAFVTLVTGRMSHALGSTAQGGGASQPA